MKRRDVKRRWRADKNRKLALSGTLLPLGGVATEDVATKKHSQKISVIATAEQEDRAQRSDDTDANDGDAGTSSSLPMLLLVDDARQYLDDVRVEFGVENVRVYNDFMVIMKSFTNAERDASRVRESVLMLFRGHRSLIMDFNKFLPEGDKTSLELLEEWDKNWRKMDLIFDDIRCEFREDRSISEEIIAIILSGESTTPRAIDRLSELLCGHDRILLNLNSFLEDNE